MSQTEQNNDTAPSVSDADYAAIIKRYEDAGDVLNANIIRRQWAAARARRPLADANRDKLLTIIAAAYQIAGAHDAPAHILDVLADPENATTSQVDAMLPYVPIGPERGGGDAYPRPAETRMDTDSTGGGEAVHARPAATILTPVKELRDAPESGGASQQNENGGTNEPT